MYRVRIGAVALLTCLVVGCGKGAYGPALKNSSVNRCDLIANHMERTQCVENAKDSYSNIQQHMEEKYRQEELEKEKAASDLEKSIKKQSETKEDNDS